MAQKPNSDSTQGGRYLSSSDTRVLLAIRILTHELVFRMDSL